MNTKSQATCVQNRNPAVFVEYYVTRQKNGFKVPCTNNSRANRLYWLAVDLYLQGKQWFSISLIISNMIFSICLPLDFGKCVNLSIFPAVCLSLSICLFLSQISWFIDLTMKWAGGLWCSLMGGYLRPGFVVMQLHGRQCVMNRKSPVPSYEKSQRSCTRDSASHFMKFYSAASPVMASTTMERCRRMTAALHGVCVCVMAQWCNVHSKKPLH